MEKMFVIVVDLFALTKQWRAHDSLRLLQHTNSLQLRHSTTLRLLNNSPRRQLVSDRTLLLLLLLL